MANLGSFRILLPFFRKSWGAGVLNSAILTVCTIGLSLARFWRALGIFFWGGEFEPPKPLLGKPLAECEVKCDLFVYYLHELSD